MKQPTHDPINLIIDVGNTRTKYAFFQQQSLLEEGTDSSEMLEKIATYTANGIPLHLMLSGSGAIPDQLREQLQTHASFFREATSSLPLPIRLGYETPHTLGIDRIAACMGGAFLFPGQDLLIIDSGTAITFDFFQRDGLFLGGNISPGIPLRLRSLHEFTSKLPLVEYTPTFTPVGKNTREAILNGVLNGMLYEVRGYIDQFQKKHPHAVTLLTGGGSDFLKETLKREVHFEKNLVFIGLNQLLEYQKRLIP